MHVARRIVGEGAKYRQNSAILESSVVTIKQARKQAWQ